MGDQPDAAEGLSFPELKYLKYWCDPQLGECAPMAPLGLWYNPKFRRQVRQQFVEAGQKRAESEKRRAEKPEKQIEHSKTVSKGIPENGSKVK